MSDTFTIGLATAADLEVISHHRARMFSDMGTLPPEMFDSFRIQSLEALRSMFKRGVYVGWLASPQDDPEKIVAGAGVQVREMPPRPQSDATGKIDIVAGKQIIIQNVYTELEWRRRGLASLLIKSILDWAHEDGIDSVVLHASEKGRAVYERLGFIPTNEMRFRKS